MKPENIVLAVLIGGAAACAGGLILFYRRTARRRSTRRSPKDLVLGNVLLLAALLLVAALSGEIYYRFLYDSTDSFGLTKVTVDWFHRHYAFNASGVRDSLERYVTRLSPGRRRVTFVGDSFTAGHGVANVEDRFANLVRRSRPAWEVHVIASNGWDTGEELAALQSLVRRNNYELDVVVLVYNLNDIADIVPEWQAVLKRIYGGPPPGFLARSSYLVNTLYFRWRTARDPDIARYYDFVRAAYDGPLWDAQKGRLIALRDFVAAQRGRLAVVTFPFVHTAGAADPYAAALEKLAAFWKEADVPYLDLSGAFRDRRPAALVVNRHDSHPNELAHRLAAERITAFLEAPPLALK